MLLILTLLVSVTAGVVDVKVVKMFAARYLEDGSGKGNTKESAWRQQRGADDRLEKVSVQGKKSSQVKEEGCGEGGDTKSSDDDLIRPLVRWDQIAMMVMMTTEILVYLWIVVKFSQLNNSGGCNLKSWSLKIINVSHNDWYLCALRYPK